MNHAELVAAITNDVGQDRPLSKADVAAVLNSLSRVATVELYQGGEVPLKDLGKLKTTVRAARTGHNPKTGEPVQIPVKTVPAFSASKTLKDVVNS